MSSSSDLILHVRKFLDVAIHHSMRQRAHLAKATGLSMPQFGILMQLHYHGSCNISDISERFGITLPAASQMVERLVHAGLVARLEDPHDRRARQLALTTRGAATIEKSASKRYQWLDALAVVLTPTERQNVAMAMRVLAEAAQRMDQEP